MSNVVSFTGTIGRDAEVKNSPSGQSVLELTQERLKEVVNYDAKTGVFTWNKRLSNRIIIGSEAGNSANGYIQISIDNKSYQAHRLAWLWTYGEMPKLFIDHIDGNRSNNRIENLRQVSSIGNQQNTHSAQKNSKVGLLGVSHHGKTGKFRSRIMANRKVNELGFFNTKEEAHQAYLTAKRQLHQTCSI
jgi:hypothetical protein